MRFSLSSLLIFALWVAGGMATYIERSAWREMQWPGDAPRIKTAEEFSSYFNVEDKKSPDGSRFLPLQITLCRDPNYFQIKIWDAGTREEIYSSGPGIFSTHDYWNTRFYGDDIILAARAEDNGFHHCAFRRRFPEWWWGHFYRPEVWAFLVLTGVLIIRIIRARRMRGKTTSTLSA